MVLEDKIIVEEKDPVEVVPEADLNKNEEPKKEEEKKDKIFVRPRFVKVIPDLHFRTSVIFLYYPGGVEHNQEAVSCDNSRE